MKDHVPATTTATIILYCCRVYRIEYIDIDIDIVCVCGTCRGLEEILRHCIEYNTGWLESGRTSTFQHRTAPSLCSQSLHPWRNLNAALAYWTSIPLHSDTILLYCCTINTKILYYPSHPHTAFVPLTLLPVVPPAFAYCTLLESCRRRRGRSRRGHRRIRACAATVARAPQAIS